MSNETSSFEKFNNWTKNSLGVRIFTIAYFLY